jgi:oligoendopeptidase F
MDGRMDKVAGKRPLGYQKQPRRTNNKHPLHAQQVDVDGCEWMWIRHFNMPFYTYDWATAIQSGRDMSAKLVL